MASSTTTSTEIVFDIPNFMRLYKNGTVERLGGTATVPPSIDPVTGVQSKDVVLLPETGVSARLYIPKTTAAAGSDQKLPLLVYFHGGGFCIETSSSPTYHNYLNSLVAEANVVAVSVDYRRVPEHPLPIAFDDSWDSLKWVASHSAGNGDEPWLNDHVDFQRVFIAGDSAGGSISHNMGIRVGSEKLNGVNLVGIVLIHPFFWGKDPIGSESANGETKAMVDNLWRFVHPSTTSGLDDPLINVVLDPKLSGLGCTKVLVCVAEKDALRDRGWVFSEELRKCGWGGEVEFMEAMGENHVFHLFNPTSDNALAMLKKVVTFLN